MDQQWISGEASLWVTDSQLQYAICEGEAMQSDFIPYNECNDPSFSHSDWILVNVCLSKSVGHFTDFISGLGSTSCSQTPQPCLKIATQSTESHTTSLLNMMLAQYWRENCLQRHKRC
jgi:hypothetical protein